MNPDEIYKMKYIGFLNWLSYFKEVDMIKEKQKI
jgi:hypothetical protein